MANRAWDAYPATYRAKEMKTLANWISAGESGSVVGLPGCGRSNLLGFLCHRPEVFQAYLLTEVETVALIPVDLNNLPANNLSTLYRVILRAFYRACPQFEPTLQQTITRLYQENRAERDPFLPQSGLQELLLLFQTRQIPVILVLNRFDRFCQVATPHMVNTLRGLRDDFKNTLYYIAGMTQEAAYLPEPAMLGHMYELLDNYVCWVGAMNEADSRDLIAALLRPASVQPDEADVAAILAVTGGYPALLRATCHWWLTTRPRPPYAAWPPTLLQERHIQHRLAKIWNGLTQEEQFILCEVQKLQLRGEPANGRERGTQPGTEGYTQLWQGFTRQHCDILVRLAAKGVCCQAGGAGWRIASELLAAYIATAEGQGRGRIWLDEKTGEVYQGQTRLPDLTALERSLLSFLLKYPYLRHTKTDLIVNAWPDELRQQGVSDNSLYQIILILRRAIEPNPSRPVYLLTWRSRPEGGYQLFPEGRPE